MLRICVKEPLLTSPLIKGEELVFVMLGLPIDHPRLWRGVKLQFIFGILHRVFAELHCVFVMVQSVFAVLLLIFERLHCVFAAIHDVFVNLQFIF